MRLWRPKRSARTPHHADLPTSQTWPEWRPPRLARGPGDRRRQSKPGWIIPAIPDAAALECCWRRPVGSDRRWAAAQAFQKWHESPKTKGAGAEAGSRRVLRCPWAGGGRVIEFSRRAAATRGRGGPTSPSGRGSAEREEDESTKPVPGRSGRSGGQDMARNPGCREVAETGDWDRGRTSGWSPPARRYGEIKWPQWTRSSTSLQPPSMLVGQ